MVNPQKLLDVRMKAFQRQIQNVKALVTEPTGIFETLDSVIKTARYANRETLKDLGVGLFGQGIILQKTSTIGGNGPIARTVGNLLRRFRR